MQESRALDHSALQLNTNAWCFLFQAENSGCGGAVGVVLEHLAPDTIQTFADVKN